MLTWPGEAGYESSAGKAWMEGQPQSIRDEGRDQGVGVLSQGDGELMGRSQPVWAVQTDICRAKEMLSQDLRSLKNKTKTILCGGGSFCGGSDGKECACNAGDMGLIPGPSRSPGGGNGPALQYSCPENPMGGGAWCSTVHGVVKDSDLTERLNPSILWRTGKGRWWARLFLPSENVTRERAGF